MKLVGARNPPLEQRDRRQAALEGHRHTTINRNVHWSDLLHKDFAAPEKIDLFHENGRRQGEGGTPASARCILYL